MKKAERKAREALTRHVEQMHADGQGVWQLTVYNLAGAAEQTAKAVAGDPYARAVVRALDSLIRNTRTANPPMLCLTCDNTLSENFAPMALVLMHAKRDDPHGTVANGICPDCCARHRFDMDRIGHAASAAYGKMLISDLRILPPINHPGHA